MNPQEFHELEAKIHPEAYAPGSPKVSREEFTELVADALDAIPQEFKNALDDVALILEDDPPADAVPGLLGLYHGVPLPKRTGGWAHGSLPDRITLYRNPIIKCCRTRPELVDRIAVTVVHEIGHYFGIDDARLHELGWA
jgi:predicted Zn-dependent protease with MMP-like domain